LLGEGPITAEATDMTRNPKKADLYDISVARNQNLIDIDIILL